MSTGLYDGCSMGELLVRAIQRGGDRDAFILDDRRITYRAFGALLSRFIQALPPMWPVWYTMLKTRR